MEGRQYLVLDSPIPKASLELGSLVIDYRHPTRDLFFDNGLKETQKYWVRTDKNVEELMTIGSSQTEKSLLRRMLSTSPANDLSETYELQSLECRVYELINASVFFKEILSLPGARLWARTSLKSRREVYLLTGYRTFREGILRKRQNVKHTVSAEIHVPGPPGISGVSLGGGGSEGQESYSQYQTHEEVIFAVSYRTIKPKLFGQRRKASLERGRDWLRPWTRFQARSTGYGSASIGSHQSIAAVNLINNFQLPSTDVTSALHELVIEIDESEEVLQLEEVEVSRDDDYRAEFFIEDDAWRDTSDRSPVWTERRFDGVEGLFKIFIRSSDLRPVYAKAVQVASESAFEIVLDRHLQEIANSMHAIAAEGNTNFSASFLRSRAPLVATLITEYIYSLHARGLTLPTASEEDWVNLNRFLEEKDKWLYPFDEIEREWNDLRDTNQTSQSPSKDVTMESMGDLISLWASESLLSGLRDFTVDGRSARKTSWTRTFIDKYDQFDLRLGLVLTLGSSPYILFLLRRFWHIIAAALITHFIRTQSPILFSSYSRASFTDVCQKAERHLRVPVPLFITSFVSYLKILSRPKVKPGYRRIEWICECGEPLYGDFDNSDPESFDVLEERLHLSRPLSNESSVAPSGNTPSALPQAHVNTSGALSRGSTVRSRTLTSDIPARFATPSPSTSPVRPARKKYFELCINYGKWERRLGEIDISAIVTDGELFRAIRRKYQETRGFRTKKLYLLEPTDIHFVQFSLEERYRLNIHEEPDSWPSPEELKRKTWEYIHPPKIPAGTFLHYMSSKNPHPSAIWLPTMPKKLDKRMAEEESQLPMGWGIHVIEGLNKSLVSWLFWMVTTAVFVAGTTWSIWKQKGVAVAPLAVGILGVFLSFLTSEFYKQSEI